MQLRSPFDVGLSRRKERSAQRAIPDGQFSDAGCEPLPNSAGGISVLTATGSVSVSDNDVNLAVHGLPLGQWSYFLLSQTATNANGIAPSPVAICAA